MKGDMYDEGTPNPLVVKCPHCGGENITEYIGTGYVRYRCNGCGMEFSYTTGNKVALCPNCGALMSYDYINGKWYCISCGCEAKDDISMDDKTEPRSGYVKTYGYGWICPKCGKVYAPDVKECSDCNYLANISASGQINQSPSAETHTEVVATSTQEKRVRQDGSFVIDKSLFPNLNLTKDSTVYAGGGGTRWNNA